MNKSDDYHHYVFREGKLVGDFEAMYRNSAIIPWHQDEQANWIDVRLAKEMIRDIGEEIAQIHDLGCGTGHYLDLIAQDFRAPGGSSFGYDISETACQKAAEIFPESKFSVLDLTKQTINCYMSTQAGSERQSTRLFTIRGTLWYVYPHLATVVDNIRNMMTSEDKLLVVQNFPPLTSAFVGKEVMPDHFSLVEHFSSGFSLDRYVWYEKTCGTSNDNWFIGIFSPRADLN